MRVSLCKSMKVIKETKLLEAYQPKCIEIRKG